MVATPIAVATALVIRTSFQNFTLRKSEEDRKTGNLLIVVEASGFEALRGQIVCVSKQVFPKADNV